MLAHEVADVLQRAHGNNRELTWIPPDQIGEEFDGRRRDRLVGLEVLGPRELVVDAIGWDRRRLPPDRNRHVGSAETMEQFAGEPRALRSVRVAHRDAEQLEGRALQRIPQCPAVVDIGTDVRIEHHFHAGLLCCGWQNCCQRAGKHKRDSRAVSHGSQILQRHERVQSIGAHRRNERRDAGNEQEEQGDAAKGQRIGRADPIEESLENRVSTSPRRTVRRPRRSMSRLADDHGGYRARRRANCDTNADFVCPRPDNVGQHAVDPECRKDEGQKSQCAKQCPAIRTGSSASVASSNVATLKTARPGSCVVTAA